MYDGTNGPATPRQATDKPRNDFLKTMKHTVIKWSALLLVLPAAALAKWAAVPLEKLLMQSDVVVAARLTDVSEISTNGTDYGKGTLTITEVFRGNVKAGGKLKLEWSNATGWDCPRVEHAPHTNKTMIWLLQKSTNGAVNADHPSRVLGLESRSELEKLLSFGVITNAQASPPSITPIQRTLDDPTKR